MEADKDGDGKISFDEFCQMVASTVTRTPTSLMQDVVVSMTLEGV